MMLVMREYKKKKGNGFESAKLRITGGYLVLLPAKLYFWIRLPPLQAQSDCIPFFNGS
jgi:hypothetical protein